MTPLNFQGSPDDMTRTRYPFLPFTRGRTLCSPRAGCGILTLYAVILSVRRCDLELKCFELMEVGSWHRQCL